MKKTTVTTSKLVNSRTPRDSSAFVRAVLEHYSNGGRHTLPWRKNITPYSILISEVMLQQTQVSRVVAKYTEWMTRYPTLAALGNASLEDVLVLWKGLGYQRRAKALLSVAKQHESVPCSFSELLELPGVGSYTASAVMSFAYNKWSTPPIETNIRAALVHHFFSGDGVVMDSALNSILVELQTYPLVCDMGARQWYYALMDYGAHIKLTVGSYTTRSEVYTKQSAYKGSRRELRAKILYAIIHNEEIPDDERADSVISGLIKERFIVSVPGGYEVAKID